MSQNIFQKISQKVDTHQEMKTKKNSKEYAYCDICGDSDAALKVYPQGNWKCHSCKESGGDVIAYVAKREDISNGKAAAQLADKYNIEHDFSENKEEMSKEQQKQRKRKKRVLNCLDNVVEKAAQNLSSADKKRLKESRGWSKNTIQDLKLGRMDQQLFNQLQETWGDLLEDAGIHYGMTGGEEVDYTIVIPHLKRPGKPYLVTCMVPGHLREKMSDDMAKYIQSRSTDYIQNDVYLSLSQDSDEVIVTEGYPDGISAYEEGKDSIVAGCGSFEGEYERIANTAAKCYSQAVVVTDNDDTGKENLEKTAKHLSKKLFTSVYKFEDKPKGYDLDDFTSQEDYSIEGLISDSEDFILYLRDKYKVSDRRERSDIKDDFFEVIFELDENERQEAINDFTGRGSGLPSKGDIQTAFTQWSKHRETTEQTEQTEQTEAGTHIEPSEKEEKNYLEELANQDYNQKKRLIGQVDDTYFLTAWIEDKGLEKPAVITSNDNISFINHKLQEKQKQLGEDQELSDEQKEKYDYWYAEINGKEVKFQHEIPSKSKQAISNIDNQIIKYVIGQKQVRDKEEIFEDARNLMNQYWSHYNGEWYDISVAYSFHTYLLPALGYTAYILLKGRPQTGKSTWQKVISKLNYNGCFAGNLTPATAVRYAHSYYATLHQDEMEKQSEERRNQMQGLYNTGQRKGGVYNITNTDAGNNVADQIQEIQSFCAKSMSVNDIYGFADSFMSRNVIMKTVKTKEKGLNDPDSMTDEEVLKFRDLQAEMAYYVLHNYNEILEDIEKVRSDIEDTARDEDKMALFKGLVYHFKGEERATLVEDRIRESQKLQDVQKVGQRVVEIFNKVTKEFKEEDSKVVQLRLGDIADSVNDELGLSDDNEYKTTSKSVHKKLKEYDVVRRSSQKKKDSSGYTAVEINLREFLDACDRYEMASIYEDLVQSGSDKELTSFDDNGENGDEEDESFSFSDQDQYGSSPQSAQSAQSAQSKTVRPPNSQDILSKIEQWMNDDSRDTAEGVDVTELEEYFVEAYGDHDKVRRQFEKQPDKKGSDKTGLAKLLNEGSVYEPREDGRVKVL